MVFGDKTSSFLQKELDTLNDHLPKKRILFKDSLKGQNYISKNGQSLYITKKELVELEIICPKDKIDTLMVPFMILRRRDYGAGAYIISGDMIEQYIILKIIGKYTSSWDEYAKGERETIHPRILYKPDIIEIRKKLPTCVVIGFV